MQLHESIDFNQEIRDSGARRRTDTVHVRECCTVSVRPLRAREAAQAPDEIRLGMLK